MELWLIEAQPIGRERGARETMVDPWILLTDLCGFADLTLITRVQVLSISD